MIFNVSSGAGRNVLNYRVLAVSAAPTAAGRENDVAIVTSTPMSAAAISPERMLLSGNKNMFFVTAASRTINGVYFGIPSARTYVNVNGTATAYASFTIGEITLPAGTYTLGSRNVRPSGYTGSLYVRYKDGDVIGYLTTGTSSKTFTLTSMSTVELYVTVGGGDTVNWVIYPQIETGATATSFIVADGTGSVWIHNYPTAGSAFNAAKRGYLGVYPGECMQYDGSGWVSRDAYIYQGGAWKLLVRRDIDLYKNGTLLGSNSSWYFSGNCLNYGQYVSGYGTYPTGFIFDADEFCMAAAQSAQDTVGYSVMHKLIDFTPISKLRLKTRAYVLNGAQNVYRQFMFGVSDTTWVGRYTNQMIALGSISTAVNSLTTIELDVSAITGEHYATIYLGGYENSGGKSLTNTDHIYINEFVGVCA